MSIDSIPTPANVLHSWHVSQGELSLCKSPEGYVILLKKVDGTFHKINHSLPPALLKFDEREVKVYCESHYQKLIERNEGSSRIEMLVRDEGGMLDEDQRILARTLGVHNRSENYLEEMIRENLARVPNQPFRNITVSTEMHQFPLYEDLAASRCIQLTVGWGDSIANFFDKFFTYTLMPNPLPGTKEAYKSLMDFNAVQATLLGIRQDDEKYKDIIKAFQRNAIVTLYISIDVSEYTL